MIQYWALEYGKVFFAYIFLIFIWPLVVFWNHIKRRSAIYCFGFCVTVPIFIINAGVLLLGLLDILYDWLFACLFYGVFLIAVYNRSVRIFHFLHQKSEKEGVGHFVKIRTDILKILRRIREWISLRTGEYLLLFVFLLFGLIYFSYNVFHLHCYGQSDVAFHHLWVNDLSNGEVFSYGVYPEAMHCFIYCFSALFGVATYSVMLFLPGIHIIILFLSVYCMLREIFYWRYSAFFVLGLYLTINFPRFEYSMYRLQTMLPMEFGLYTQFICTLFLVRFIERGKSIIVRGRSTKCYWDENLFLFMISLAVSIEIHFYTTIMAFILCISFLLLRIRTIVKFRYWIPLMVSVTLGCTIAFLPMVGGVLSGIPLEGSINWGLSSITENNKEEIKEQDDAENDEVGDPLDLTAEDWEVVNRLPDLGQKVVRGIIKMEYVVKEVYRKGYQGMYRNERGSRIFAVTLIAGGLCLLGVLSKCNTIKKYVNKYFALILASFLAMLVTAAYDAPELGLPVLIAGDRYCSSAHMIVLAVMIVPIDILFFIGSFLVKERILYFVSLSFTAGIYLSMQLFNIYHSCLYYRISRYDSAVMVTNQIIKTFPKNSYTVVSPIEEICQLDLYGKHLEIYDFVRNCDEYYTIPTEYVFIYVEKKPIVYYQYYYSDAPAWLSAKGKLESEIKASEISYEAAEKDLEEFDGKSCYSAGRTILESKAYKWCQDFSQVYPEVLNVYYEDDSFVCFYLEQDKNQPYNLAIGKGK